MRIIALAVALLVAGCSTVPAPVGTPFADTIPTRSFLLRGEKLFDDVENPVKALVLLRRNDTSRNKRVCEAYVKLASTDAARQIGVPVDKLAPTFWPVSRKPTDGAGCAELLKIYDYDAAALYMQMLDRPSNDGPLLAAVARSPDDAKGYVAFIDLSRAKKKHIAALVPAWAKALNANNGEDIVIKGGILNDACDAVGVSTQKVSGGVIEIIEAASTPNLFTVLRDGLGAVVLDLLPYGSRAKEVTSKVCSVA